MRAKRIAAAQKRISRFPYRFHAVNDAYARFLKDGSLPSDDPLAAAVLHRAIHARKPPKEWEEWRLDLIASGAMRQPYGSIREMFFTEALSDIQPVRELARFLLQAVVQAGYDPTDHELIDYEVEPEDYFPVVLRLLGWPHDFVRPEYQAQLERVMRQQAELREQRPVSEAWDREARKAFTAFFRNGEPPVDSRYYLFVLTNAELFALNGHYFGKGGEELLAGFEAVATASGPERIAALKQLGELHARAREARALGVRE